MWAVLAGVIPQRIVSLAPSVTEGIYLLGAGNKLVGVTIYCNRPPEAKKKEKIGTLLEPDTEKIVSLAPDLVLGSEDGNDPRLLKKLTGIGLTIAVIPPGKSFSGLCENFLLLGRLIGRVGRAEDLVAEAKQRAADIQRRLRGASRKRVFWEIGARPLVTAGRGGYINEMTELAGGESIAHVRSEAWLRYSREEVVRSDPDAIILARMGDVGEEEKRAWRKYKAMKAVRDDRFLVLEPEDINPLPMYFVSGVEKLARFLHPEIFMNPSPKDIP